MSGYITAQIVAWPAQVIGPLVSCPSPITATSTDLGRPAVRITRSGDVHLVLDSFFSTLLCLYVTPNFVATNCIYSSILPDASNWPHHLSAKHTNTAAPDSSSSTDRQLRFPASIGRRLLAHHHLPPVPSVHEASKSIIWRGAFASPFSSHVSSQNQHSVTRQ